ncbi:adenosylhomocysteinase [Sulfobacillus thermosulfidooxidans DSM 9293]|uniref:Adenosylhomocysteinase n=2 Tax=Sulfobacillus thermosulfidooxidans TaxID=28034 RepID=A0A1W1WLC0_SULTA|nr:adenosylhomocysteinase [Sulfobacillus thermosulfidooxidans]PSR27637.1 MAG: adenosylhomocysteinase [Sulfobacillus thermosulfidooxidans]SMC06523.1 adenosylhomocysteinase [Sulfobacillus thermosulfidooxidans DSM 9293]
MSTLKDPGLASLGHDKMNWVRRKMPVLNALRDRYVKEQPFKGQRIAISLHLEAKTAVLAELLHIGGASVSITSSNPLSTQDDVAAALATTGVEVHAFRGANDEEFDQFHQHVLDIEPTLLIDDGGELTERLHSSRKDLARNVLGGAEETTTGVTRLRALAGEHRLLYPMIAVNDADMKHLFDNQYGTGQSTWDGIMRTTNLLIAGTTVVVAGYGWCGRGVADRARGLGARVIVTEVNPVRANEALMDGHQVMTMDQAAPYGDFFVTVTGNRDVIRPEHFVKMKDGAVLANAGHFDVEVDVKGLRAMATEVIPGRNENVEGFVLPTKQTLWLLAQGRLVNLAAGDGHPVEIMDLTFGLQALSLEYLLNHPLEPGVYPVDPAVDRWVAEIRLKALGIEIDTLTPDQEQYMASW